MEEDGFQVRFRKHLEKIQVLLKNGGDGNCSSSSSSVEDEDNFCTVDVNSPEGRQLLEIASNSEAKLAFQEQDVITVAYKLNTAIPVDEKRWQGEALLPEKFDPYQLPRSDTSTSSRRTRRKQKSECSRCQSPFVEKRVNYSRDEIECIYEGVRRFGPKFRIILFEYQHIFHPSRSPVKLYDKWRHDLFHYNVDDYIALKFTPNAPSQSEQSN